MEAAMAGIGIATPSPQTPTVGAGSSRFSRRFPRPSYSPYAKIPPPTAPAAQTRPRGDTLVGYGGAAPLIATRCFESRRGTPRRYKRPLRILCLPRPPQKNCPA